MIDDKTRHAELFHAAWCALNLETSPRKEGGFTYCCPVCTPAEMLTVEPGEVKCPICSWNARGEPWELTKAVASKLVEKSPAGDAEIAIDEDEGLPLLDIDDILNYEPDPKDEIWPGGILGAGDPTALIGAPGVGKSRMVLQASICTLLGKPFLGWQTRGQGLKWLFLQTENSKRRLKADLAAMTRHLTPEERAIIKAGLRILDITAKDFGTICMTEGHPDRKKIEKTLAKWGPNIVVMDPLRDAGQGDPNKDADVMETCQGIAATIRVGNPRRVPLLIHHGRTGSAEASKVFGDDAASFARNSKVLYGWLRSQINVAAAGVDWPNTVIVGCGKNSNGPRWEPFAARLDSSTMTYRRLDASEFSLEEWEEKMGAGSGKRRAKRLPTPAEVAEIVASAGGEVKGGIKSPAGLVERVRLAHGVTRAEAQTAIEAAESGGVITEREEKHTSHRRGGKPVRIYVLHPDKKYEPK